MPDRPVQPRRWPPPQADARPDYLSPHASALSLTCPHDHSHALVEGAATAQSAMYSPRLAHLIASAVLGRPADAGQGGRSATVDEATRKVGGSEPEARSSPGLGAGNPLGTGNPWRCGLKAPEDPLEAAPSQPAQEACEAYLDYLREAPYSKGNFVERNSVPSSSERMVGGKKRAEPLGGRGSAGTATTSSNSTATSSRDWSPRSSWPRQGRMHAEASRRTTPGGRGSGSRVCPTQA